LILNFSPLISYLPTHTHFHNYISFLLFPQATTGLPTLHAQPHQPHPPHTHAPHYQAQNPHRTAPFKKKKKKKKKKEKEKEKKKKKKKKKLH
jgi:outer membrane biosynthesis protein TonB